MSIHTTASPENSNIRVENQPQKRDTTANNTPHISDKSEVVEINVNIPMLLLVIAALIGVVWGGYWLFKNGFHPAVQKDPPATLKDGLADVTVTLDNAVIKGDAKSQYVFIEYSDFECPYCKLFETGYDPRVGVQTTSAYSQIQKDFVTNGKMQYAYLPYIAVPQHNPAATNEAVGLYCANAQGKGFDYSEAVFAQSQSNGLGIDGKGAQESSLIALASSLKLDTQKFTDCYRQRDVATIDSINTRVNQQVRDPWAALYGSENFGTPAFAICKRESPNSNTCQGKAFVGAWPYSDMQSVINDFLGIKTTPSPTK